MQKFLSLLIAIGLVLAAALFYAAPIISFHDMRSAAQSQDIQSLSRLINFDKLRVSIRSQILAGETGVAAPAPNDPIGATGDFLKRAADSVGKAFTEAFDQTARTTAAPPPDPESYLRPPALLALTYGYGKDANTATIPAGTQPPSPEMAFFSLNFARMTITDEVRGTTTFTFERKGIYSWQLVHIGFPGTAIELTPSEAKAAASSSVSQSPSATPPRSLAE